MNFLSCVTSIIILAATSSAVAQTQSTVRRNAGRGYDEFVSSDGRVAQTDNTGKGAVMCLLGIYESAQIAGDECHKGQDAEFQAELSRLITQVRLFVVNNSSKPITQVDLDHQRMAFAKQIQTQGSICRSGADQLYIGLRTRGGAALRVGTAEALSVPREPVMNPCL